MARVAVVLAPDFEDPEFTGPRDALVEAGHTVDVIGSDAGDELTGKRGDATVVTDLAVGDAEPGDYDALVIPGGYSPDKLRTDEDIVDFVRKLGSTGVPVAAICHAGSLLIEAGMVDGKRVTSWPSIRTDLVNAGADWEDAEVVVDGALITSRKPDDIPTFNATLLEMLDAAN